MERVLAHLYRARARVYSTQQGVDAARLTKPIDTPIPTGLDTDLNTVYNDLTAAIDDLERS